MQPFTSLTSVAVPLIRANVDTDAIIPSREMRSVSKSGLADGLFGGWRYRTIGGRDPDPGFVLNNPAYEGAAILLGGENFGCGSSREHAVWALVEYGFRVIVAPSFNPIFRNNCHRNGVLAAVCPIDAIHSLHRWTVVDPRQRRLTVDLESRRILADGHPPTAFGVGDAARQTLLTGMDDIALTLAMSEGIDAFRMNDCRARPWAYLEN